MIAKFHGLGLRAPVDLAGDGGLGPELVVAVDRQYQRVGAGRSYRGGVVGAAVVRPDPASPGPTPVDDC